MMKVAISTVLILLLFPTFCYSDTIHIPAGFATIQEGIDAAVHGDTVLVAPGTYVEIIDFLGKGITVKSSGGAEVTTINADRTGSVVSFMNGEGVDSVLEGFLLTNGSGTLFDYNIYTNVMVGGGIFCTGSSPVIKDNTIFGHFLGQNGAGIFCYEASPIIEGNLISENLTIGSGAGICCFSNCSPVIENNTISDNYAGLDGGGILCYLDSTPTIVNNEITCNTAEGKGGGIHCGVDSPAMIASNLIIANSTCADGGGIYCYSSSPTIFNNTISENYAKWWGGGIHCWSNSSPMLDNNTITNNTSKCSGGGVYQMNSPVSMIITNNTVSGNTAEEYGGGGFYFSQASSVLENNVISNNSGGGIRFFQSSSSTMTNNIIYGNTSDRGSGLYFKESSGTLVNNTIAENKADVVGAGILCWSYSTVSLKNIILWGNTAPAGPEIWMGLGSSPSTLAIDYSDLEGGQASVFVAYGNTLDWGENMFKADPKFVDSGNGDFHLTYNSPCRDAGDSSVVMDPEDFEGDPRIVNSSVDMGADEFHTHLYCTGDFSVAGAIEGKFIGLPDSEPVGLFMGSGVLDPPLQHKWGAFYLDSPWFLFPLIPIPAKGVLEIPAVLPSNPAPYDIAMQALIGWELSNLFVLEVR